jgi:hypothetical protein
MRAATRYKRPLLLCSSDCTNDLAARTLNPPFRERSVHDDEGCTLPARPRSSRRFALRRAQNPYPDEIAYAPCPQCGVLMWLTRIEPDGPDRDKHTFECQPCGATAHAVKPHPGRE